MKRKTLINIFSVAAFLMLAYSVAAYVYLQTNLTPQLPELTGLLRAIGNLIIPALFIVGLYHLYLLAQTLKTLTGSFWSSVLYILILLSGVMLFSDLAILSDIGKEYLLFDVTNEWIMLYCSAGLHLAAMAFGLAAVKRAQEQGGRLFEAFAKSAEGLFLSVHQISLVSGMLGVLGVILAETNFIVDERFSGSFAILLAGLALIPLVMIVVFWIVKMRKKPVKEWMDEKQLSDTALGGLFGLIAGVILYAAVFVLDFFKAISQPVSFWILLMFFVQLIVYSAVIMIRNRQQNA